MVDHDHALPESYQLQEYTITGTLGFNGFGISNSAHDKNLDKIVAIKGRIGLLSTTVVRRQNYA